MIPSAALQPPTKSGTPSLWAIHELCIASKHHLVLRVIAQTGVRLPFITSTDGRGPIEIIEGVGECAENEVIFARTPLGFKWKYRLQVAFGIAFDEIEPVKSMPVYPNLKLMLERAIATVDAIEVECRRIGLLT
jgi:hypothetical protein